ncbi:MAG: hypothetical protein OXI59_03975 [Gemmatimonadota bacterium]|nr:hypothetical protein [Gemmatimonadota bacterium]
MKSMTRRKFWGTTLLGLFGIGVGVAGNTAKAAEKPVQLRTDRADAERELFEKADKMMAEEYATEYEPVIFRRFLPEDQPVRRVAGDKGGVKNQERHWEDITIKGKVRNFHVSDAASPSLDGPQDTCYVVFKFPLGVNEFPLSKEDTFIRNLSKVWLKEKGNLEIVYAGYSWRITQIITKSRSPLPFVREMQYRMVEAVTSYRAALPDSLNKA